MLDLTSYRNGSAVILQKLGSARRCLLNNIKNGLVDLGKFSYVLFWFSSVRNHLNKSWNKGIKSVAILRSVGKSQGTQRWTNRSFVIVDLVPDLTK